ncbi:MAG: hypothetical protein KAR31_08690 [Candidatus Omnitrophica bacterium]|nr:hypothetical protein [Candidatus Omnitrophota bacterium]
MRFPNISKNRLIAMILAPLLFLSSGCIYLVVGGIGAVGGYIVSPDTVEGITENDTETVWDSAIEVLSIMGLIEEENEAGGMILASVGRAKITVTIISLSPTTAKVTVKARKAYLPRISLAQDVFVKIMSRVNE